LLYSYAVGERSSRRIERRWVRRRLGAWVGNRAGVVRCD
jgi:hypothetical protein